MTRIYHEVIVNAPKQRVWEIIADLGGAVNFHPYVNNSYYTSDKLSEVGAARVCELPQGVAIQETAVAWDEGESFTLAIDFMKGMKPPINDLQATMAVREDNGRTVASIDMSYQPKMGVIGTMMDGVLMRPQYTKMLNGMMTGLKHHAETGEQVPDQSALKRIRAVA